MELDHKRQSDGFTLVEQLVAIAIIGILAALAIAFFLGQADKARYAQINSDLYHIALTVREYRLEEGRYPEDRYPNIPPIDGKFFPVQPNTPFDGKSEYDYDYFEYAECFAKISNTGKNRVREDNPREPGRIGEIEITGDDRAITIDRWECGI